MSMAPEAKLVEYARRIHLTDKDVDYILSLFREARASSAIASAEHEREACARLAEAQVFYPDTHTGMRQQWVKEKIAAAIRARKDQS